MRTARLVDTMAMCFSVDFTMGRGGTGGPWAVSVKKERRVPPSIYANASPTAGQRYAKRPNHCGGMRQTQMFYTHFKGEFYRPSGVLLCKELGSAWGTSRPNGIFFRPTGSFGGWVFVIDFNRG